MLARRLIFSTQRCLSTVVEEARNAITNETKIEPISTSEGSPEFLPKRTKNPPYIPWTPTDQLQKKKDYFKRMRFLLQVFNSDLHFFESTFPDIGKGKRSDRELRKENSRIQNRRYS